MPHVVFLCTGNAARSVMAGAILAAHVPDSEVDAVPAALLSGTAGAERQRERPMEAIQDLQITTAGTHVIEGMPMSWRTKAALDGLEVGAPGHRSMQLRDDHVDAADLVVGLASEHVAYVRRVHPEAAARTGTLRRLARDLPTAPGTFAERVAGLGLAEFPLEAWEDVDDPAGGDLPEFEACAQEIHELLRELAPALRATPTATPEAAT